MTETAHKKRPKVLIIGAGFGGLQAAKSLAGKDVDVMLVDKRNHHLFQPLLYQVATAALTAAEIAMPIRQIMRKADNVAVYMNEISSIDKIKKVATTVYGRKFHYDYLIIATGAQHSYFGNDQWQQFAPGLKCIEDAREIRQRILTAFEKAEMAETEEDRLAYLNFVIVGAGPTGVELAGAIAELSRQTLSGDFHHITPESARIVLIDAAPRVLMAFDEELSNKAVTQLESLGVEIKLNAMVKDMEVGFVKFGEETLSARTIIWAAGVQASPAAKWLDAECDRTGRVMVDDHLNLPSHPEIYIIGDTACYTPKGQERPLPGIAPVAKQMGKYIATDLLTQIEGKPRKKFKYTDYGSMATIGRNRAIGDLNGIKVSGFFGWLMWCVMHVYFLIGFRNRFIVSMRWLLSYITRQRGVRLIIGGGKISDLPHKSPDQDFKV
ncbi:MAG: NAD(P)/FAD-dependent oxidoreductase [Alphaproteobacteria bacterium]